MLLQSLKGTYPAIKSENFTVSIFQFAIWYWFAKCWFCSYDGPEGHMYHVLRQSSIHSANCAVPASSWVTRSGTLSVKTRLLHLVILCLKSKVIWWVPKVVCLTLCLSCWPSSVCSAVLSSTFSLSGKQYNLSKHQHPKCKTVSMTGPPWGLVAFKVTSCLCGW